MPEDLLVASTRDLRETPARAELTTVEFHPEVLGEAAIDLLLLRLDGRELPALGERTVPATVSVRASTRRHHDP